MTKDVVSAQGGGMTMPDPRSVGNLTPSRITPEWLMARLRWTKDRWQDIAEDADDISREFYGKDADEQGGKIGGIKAVAENERYACGLILGTARVSALPPSVHTADKRMFDTLREAINLLGEHLWANSYACELAEKCDAMLDLLEPFVYAAEEFSLAHIACDRDTENDDVDEEIALSHDEDYCLTKRALVDAYGVLEGALHAAEQAAQQ